MPAEWGVGSVRITKIVEHELTPSFDQFLANVPAQPEVEYPWLRPDFMTEDGQGRTAIQGFLIDTGSLRILVDTCIGNLREMPGVMPAMPSDFLGSLAGCGYDLADIDLVLCTHLHFDHVGWNTQFVDGQWRPTFPNARYLFARREWEFWGSNRSAVVDLSETVTPIVDSGRADLVETDHLISAEVRLEPTPGHSPGHVSVHIDSDDDHAVITGDLAHHPIQFADPQICSTADWDMAGSEATRRSFLAARERDGVLVIGTHFAGPTAGHIHPDGSGWRFVAG